MFTYPLEVQLVRPLMLIGAFKLGITGPPGVYTVLSSTNLTVWSAVGVATNPLGSVNFHDFGTMFRDHLGCRDALFLDGGSASALYSPELGRNDGPGHGGFGPIIGVVAKAPGT